MNAPAFAPTATGHGAPAAAFGLLAIPLRAFAPNVVLLAPGGVISPWRRTPRYRITGNA